MKNREIIFNGKSEVHADGVITDYTLCGHDQDGDDNCGGDSWTHAQPTDKPINCKNCITIINYVKKSKFKIAIRQKKNKENAVEQPATKIRIKPCENKDCDDRAKNCQGGCGYSFTRGVSVKQIEE